MDTSDMVVDMETNTTYQYDTHIEFYKSTLTGTWIAVTADDRAWRVNHVDAKHIGLDDLCPDAEVITHEAFTVHGDSHITLSGVSTFTRTAQLPGTTLMFDSLHIGDVRIASTPLIPAGV